MRTIQKMPLFLKISLILMAIALASGQLWLHADASRGAVADARSAMVSCPVLGRAGDVTSRWDVIRAHDRVWMRIVLSQTGLVRPCR